MTREEALPSRPSGIIRQTMGVTAATALDSSSIRTTRGVFELAHPRAITTEDAQRAIQAALPITDPAEIQVRALNWQVDGRTVESPVGDFGSSVTVTAELL